MQKECSISKIIVHENFKVALLFDYETIKSADPSLINKFEKHNLKMK